MGHISKEELKHDAVKDFLIRIVEFVILHKERVITGSIIVLIVLFGIAWYQTSANKKIEEASVILTDTNAAFFTGQYDNAIAGYNNLIENYSGTPAANKAYFFVATAYYYSRKYDEAEKNFNKYIKRGKHPLFKAASLMGLGSIREQQGKFEDAIKYYEEMIKKYPKSVLVPYAYIAVGRCYEMLGKNDKAEEVYAYVKNKYPDSEISNESDFYKKLVKGRMEAQGSK